VIPIAPLVWIAVWAIRAAYRKRNGPATPPPASTNVTWRGFVLFLWTLFAWIWLGALGAAVTERTLLAWIASHPQHHGALTATLAGLTPLLMLVVAPGVLLVVGPRWLAWRVLRPLRLRLAARVTIWFTPFLRRTDVAGFARLLDASLGRPVVPPPRASRLRLVIGGKRRPLARPVVRADAWTTCARALEATLQGDRARADLLLAWFDDLPRGARVPRLLRTLAFEELAAGAARRGEWDRVERWTRAGRGRGVRLWRLLARARRGPTAAPARLWLAWLLAPDRRLSLPHVLALTRARLGEVIPAPTAPAAGGAPWTRHVDLLCRASLGAPLETRAALGLLHEWEARLGPDAEAAFRARAIELSVTDGAALWGRLRERVTAELELLLEAAGVSAEALEAHAALGAALAARLRERLFASLHAFLGAGGTLGTPLEEWERWLHMRAAARRLEERAGLGALQTAWHGGLRDTAWNRPCRVFNTYRADAAHACHAMFAWTAALAARLGDEEAARVNASNAAIAAQAA
jgi:hypothetical protein